nr:retrovirus-related Pol polyprotein from transposon TNT 1-94 [Tanacetum cinerariifolium]
MKAKLALIEVNASTSQNPKTYQSKNKGLVAKTFDWDEEEVSDDEELTQVNVLMALADDELTVGKNHARNELLTESSSKKDVNENLFIPASMGYDQEMVLKSKDYVERHNPNSKLLNFNTGRIQVLESQAVNECLKPTEASDDSKSSKDHES